MVSVGYGSGFSLDVRASAGGADAIASADPILLRADILLRSMRDTLDESVFLSKANGLRATYLLVVQSSNLLRTVISPGEKLRSLHATSTGKAPLTSLDKVALDAYLATADLKPLTPHSVFSMEAGVGHIAVEPGGLHRFAHRSQSRAARPAKLGEVHAR